MFNLLFIELKKFFKFKVVKLSILFSIFITIIFSFFSKSSVSAFDVQVNTLRNLGSLFFISILVSTVSYIYSLEVDFKTLKIIRSKEVHISKIYLSKFLTGIIFCIILFFLIYVFSLLIGTLTHPIKELTPNSLNLNLDMKGSFLFVLRLYINQFIASIFILTLSLFIAILTQKTIVPIISIPIILSASNYLLNAGKVGLPVFMLPLCSDNIYLQYFYDYNSINERLVCLLIYSLILSLINIYFLKNKEVKL